MYRYPLTFVFSAMTVSPRIQVRDASGTPVCTVAKKLLSSKDDIEATAGAKPLFKIISQESRITDIPSNWNITAPDGHVLGIVDDDFLTALDGLKFPGSPALSAFTSIEISRSLGLHAAKMYWIKDAAGQKLGFIAPDGRSLAMETLPLYPITSKLPFASRLITPLYAVQLGGKLLMRLKKERTLFTDTYTLESADTFTEQQEQLLIPAVALTILYERQRLKDLYS